MAEQLARCMAKSVYSDPPGQQCNYPPMECSQYCRLHNPQYQYVLQGQITAKEMQDFKTAVLTRGESASIDEVNQLPDAVVYTISDPETLGKNMPKPFVFRLPARITWTPTGFGMDIAIPTEKEKHFLALRNGHVNMEDCDTWSVQDKGCLPQETISEACRKIVDLVLGHNRVDLLPEWIKIPEWAEKTFIAQRLRIWIIPEALRRGYKAVWLRATAEHKRYLQPVKLTQEPLNVHVTFANPGKHKVGDSIQSTDVDWDMFPKANEGHLLLDAVEVRWGKDYPNWVVLFNDEVDLSIFDWQDRLEELSKQHPGKYGGSVRHADGTETECPEVPQELQDHIDARPNYDYGFTKWRLDTGQQYIYNTSDMLRNVGIKCEAGERSAPTPADTILLTAEDKLRFHVETDEKTPSMSRAYTLTATLNAEALSKILELTGGGHGDLPQEEAARLTDTLVLKCSDPDKLNMNLTEQETDNTVPATTLTEFLFNISTKFDLTSEGVAFEIGGQPLLLKPGTPSEWEEWYTPDKTLEDLVRVSKEEEAQDSLPADDNAPEQAPTPPLPQGNKLPDDTSQYTFEEMRAVSYAMADTSTLRYWTPTEKGSNLSIPSMLYKRPNERFEIKFDPAGLTNDLRTGLQLETTDAINEFLRQRGWKANLTLQMMGKAAILKTDEPIALDDFVNKLFDPRTAQDRRAARGWVWDTIRTILALRLYGARAGVYKDPDTKKPIDLTFRGEPFIVLSPGARKFAMGQQPLWPDSAIPVTLGFTMGAWGKEMKKHHAIISQFGKLDQVLAISAGKPAGAWAQCILFNLNQKWREKAKDVSVTTHTRTDGNGNNRKVIATRWPQAFTRRELLCDLCPPDQAFSVTDILNGKDPSRAKRYWNAAIKILQNQGSFSYYKELAPLDPKRKGWAEDWLDQPLDIRPNEDSKKDAREIKASHQKALSTRKRKPKSNEKR